MRKKLGGSWHTKQQQNNRTATTGSSFVTTKHNKVMPHKFEACECVTVWAVAASLALRGAHVSLHQPSPYSLSLGCFSQGYVCLILVAGLSSTYTMFFVSAVQRQCNHSTNTPQQTHYIVAIYGRRRHQKLNWHYLKFVSHINFKVIYEWCSNKFDKL